MNRFRHAFGDNPRIDRVANVGYEIGAMARGMGLDVEVLEDYDDPTGVIVTTRRAMPQRTVRVRVGPVGGFDRDAVLQWLRGQEPRPTVEQAGDMARRAVFAMTGEHAHVAVLINDSGPWAVDVCMDGPAEPPDDDLPIRATDAPWRSAMSPTPRETLRVRIEPGWVRDLQMAVGERRLGVEALGRWLQRDPPSRTRKPWRLDVDRKPVVSPWELIHRAIDLSRAGLDDDPWL